MALQAFISGKYVFAFLQNGFCKSLDKHNSAQNSNAWLMSPLSPVRGLELLLPGKSGRQQKKI